MIVVRTIKPGKPFQSSIFREEMTAAAKEIQGDILKDFQRTVVTWRHKVKFTSKIATVGTQSVRIIVETADKIFGYIDRGTKVRYATMSPDWKSKTEPDVVQAFPGRGRMLFVSKKRPRPGIQARGFSKHIAKTYKPELQRVVKNALARAARRCGHGRK